MANVHELITAAKIAQATEYAKFEIYQHDHRVKNKARSEMARYNLSTPTKMHMSSLMFIAWQNRKWVTVTQAAEEIHISRQAATTILNECHDAGWVECRKRGYRYTDKCARHYIDAIDDMLSTSTTNFTGSMQKISVLREIASTHFTLTESRFDTILRTGGEHRETKKA